jgi:hypothetical protein
MNDRFDDDSCADEQVSLNVSDDDRYSVNDDLALELADEDQALSAEDEDAALAEIADDIARERTLRELREEPEDPTW